jgi:NADH-quinone oxidoreductase subunit D
MWVWRYREPLLDLFELIMGNRNHYAVNKIGGARRDILPEDHPKIEKYLDLLEEKNTMFTSAILDDPVIVARRSNCLRRFGSNRAWLGLCD